MKALEPDHPSEVFISDYASLTHYIAKSFSIPSELLLTSEPRSTVQAREMQRVADELSWGVHQRFERDLLARVMLRPHGKMARVWRKQDQAWKNMNRPGLSRRRRNYWSNVWMHCVSKRP